MKTIAIIILAVWMWIMVGKINQLRNDVDSMKQGYYNLMRDENQITNSLWSLSNRVSDAYTVPGNFAYSDEYGTNYFLFTKEKP